MVLLGLALCGCSQKRMQAKDLKYEVQNAAQLSRECEVLLELRSQEKVATRFRQTHEYYLTQQVEDLEKNLEKEPPVAPIQQVGEAYKAQLQHLKEVLAQIEPHPDKQTFSDITRQFESLEKQL